MLKQYLLSPTCIKCGSFFCDDSLFCKVCYEAEILARIFKGLPSHMLEHRHLYLLEWHKNESDALSQMVYRLKSDNSKQAWAFYARIFYKISKNTIDFKNYQALIPVPSAKLSSLHSKIFAQELSKLSGIPMLDILIKSSQAMEQKKLSAEQRKQEVCIQLKVGFCEQITKCIFVDDILTTGQSFLQCNRALGGGFENVILSLFYRPKASYEV